MAHGVPFAWRAVSLITSDKLSPSPALSSQALHTIYSYKCTCLLNAHLVKRILPEAGDYFLLARHYVIRCPAGMACGRDSKFFAEIMNRSPRYEFLSLVFF